jgi:hypothetical protein
LERTVSGPLDAGKVENREQRLARELGDPFHDGLNAASWKEEAGRTLTRRCWGGVEPIRNQK